MRIYGQREKAPGAVIIDGTRLFSTYRPSQSSIAYSLKCECLLQVVPATANLVGASMIAPLGDQPRFW